MIDGFLSSIGLNDNERRVYIYLLSHGSSIASIISKRLGIKRPTIYQALESLEERGFVSKVVKNNVSHFDTEDTQCITNFCEAEIVAAQELTQRSKSIQKELKDIQKNPRNITDESQEKIQYYEGLAAVTDLIDETLEEDCDEQLCFGLNGYHTDHAGNDWNYYTETRVKNGIRVKSIQPNSHHAIAYQKRDASELRQTFLVPEKDFPSDCEINIMGDMIAMLSVRGKNPIGMKIYNKSMAQALRSIFLLAWERAKDYNEELE